MYNFAQFKTKIQRWGEDITAAYGDSVGAIVAVGEKLKLAKADCSHGEWGELTGRTTGKPLLPFSHVTATRLKAIASNASLSNAAHVQHLPASWRTLAELASLDAADIEAAIADGEIYPEMQRKDAKKLKSHINGLRKPPATPPDSVDIVSLAQHLAHQHAAAINQGIMDHLAAADNALADAKDLAYFNMAFREEAMAHATRIVKQLEKLPCK